MGDWSFFGLDDIHVFIYFQTYLWSGFCLDPSWSKSDLVWCWCSMKLFMFNRRTPTPNCECQAGSQKSGAASLFLSRHYKTTHQKGGASFSALYNSAHFFTFSPTCVHTHTHTHTLEVYQESVYYCVLWYKLSALKEAGYYLWDYSQAVLAEITWLLEYRTCALGISWT